MINEIKIEGFKCLKDADLELSSLNILAGPNASGKSSVLQSLLLLRQSTNEMGLVANLNLQGDLYEGGLALDILHPEAERTLKFRFVCGTLTYTLMFRADRDSPENHRRLTAINNSTSIINIVSGLEVPEEICSKQFIYLNAERISPKVFYPLISSQSSLAGVLGKHGEYTISYLASIGSDTKIDNMKDGSSAYNFLGEAIFKIDNIDIRETLNLTQGRLDLVANEILGWIIPDAKFEVEENSSVDTAKLQFIRDPLITKTKVRPTHIGFGLTYLLPVITGALLLRQEGTLIVENPEAHLHPFSQSRIGAFLALMAATGKQIFVETHSDHVINGVRLAVSKNILNSEHLRLFSFDKPVNGSTAQVTKITCDSNGRLDKWPKGFFDQMENDLSELG